MKNTIRIYKNSIWIHFEERGSNFTTEVSHKNKWLSIIRFLKKRGFSVSENDYYKKQYSCLSKFHKIGYKKYIVCLIELQNSGIQIEFGNIQNLWVDMPQSFWSDKEDYRYSELTYLEEISIKLEINKLFDFCKKYDLIYKTEDSSLLPEEYILKKEKANTHIHGGPKTLKELSESIKIDGYNYLSNSDDAKKNKIHCGEERYFYSYKHGGRFSKGIVWHNINNMWWVIVNNELCNVASFELHDFDNSLIGRKKLTNIQQKNKLNSVLSKHEKSQNYERCISLRNKINTL